MGREYDRVPSVCPFCSVGCRVEYDAETGRATGGEGGPANPGGRLCPKGIAAFDALDADDRLTEPLVREGGDLVPASWEEALDRVEAGISGVRERHGPDALAFLGSPHCTNEENYLFSRIARLLGTNNVDNRARSCHASAERAMRERLGSGAMTNGLADLAEADAFLVAGANPAASQPVAFDAFVRPAVNGGATLIHADPRENGTSRLADHHLAVDPGGDAALLTALAAAVVGEGLVDRAFVAERTEGFDAYADHLAGLDAVALAGSAGVDPDGVRAAARAFGRADRGAALVGTGIEGGTADDTAAADALLNLLLLTGNVGRRGTGMNLLRGLNNEQGANDMGVRPDFLPGYVPVDEPDRHGPFRDAWGAAPPTEPGRPETDLVAAFGDGVHGAFVFGENPAVSKLDGVDRRLESLEFLAVQDAFPTETVAHADVVLPASAWAEKGGTVTNMDRQVQRMRPAADPPGDARPDLDILREVGARLTGRPFEYGSPRAVFEEMTAVVGPYAGTSYAGIGDGGQRWPFPDGASEGVQILHRGRFANGRRRAPFRIVDPGGDPVEDGGLACVTGRSVASFVGALGSRSTPAEEEALWIHPADADDRGIADGAGVTVEAGGATARLAATVTDAVGPGVVFLRPAAADPLGAEDGTRVRVRPRDGRSG